MKTSTALYSSVALMQLLILSQNMFLPGDWSGIVMWLSTVIFIVATAVFGHNKAKERKNENHAERMD